MAYRETALVRAKKEAARDRILAAAHQLVAQRGFSAVSVSDVAALAEVATGSLYRHFPSKAELFSEVFRAASQREVDKVAEAIRTEGPPLDRLRHALEQFSRRALRGRRLAYALLAEPIDPLVDIDRLEYRRHYAEVFELVIREGIASGEFPQQHPAIASAALVGAIAETLVGPLAPVTHPHQAASAGPAPINENELVESILAFCIRAIAGRENMS